MRIIVRYSLPWGNFSTQAIEIEPNASVDTLQTKLFQRFNVPVRNQLIKFKRDGLIVIPNIFTHSHKDFVIRFV